MLTSISVIEFSTRVGTLKLLAETIRERLGEGPADISGVMKAINAILDESIAVAEAEFAEDFAP